MSRFRFLKLFICVEYVRNVLALHSTHMSHFSYNMLIEKNCKQISSSTKNFKLKAWNWILAELHFNNKTQKVNWMLVRMSYHLLCVHVWMFECKFIFICEIHPLAHTFFVRQIMFYTDCRQIYSYKFHKRMERRKKLNTRHQILVLVISTCIEVIKSVTYLFHLYQKSWWIFRKIKW